MLDSFKLCLNVPWAIIFFSLVLIFDLSISKKIFKNIYPVAFKTSFKSVIHSIIKLLKLSILYISPKNVANYLLNKRFFEFLFSDVFSSTAFFYLSFSFPHFSKSTIKAATVSEIIQFSGKKKKQTYINRIIIKL